MEGEPRSMLSAWNNYQSWIKTAKMQGAAKVPSSLNHCVVQVLQITSVSGSLCMTDICPEQVSHLEKGANQWVAEWKVDFELMQITPGKPYSADLEDTQMSINIALGDVDTPAEVRAS